MLDNAVTGRDEILMVDPASSTSYRWEVDAARTITGRSFRDPATAGVPIVGDFDGDGRDDVFLHATGSASRSWYTTATGVSARSLTVSNPYVVVSGRWTSACPTTSCSFPPAARTTCGGATLTAR